jgi:hypothetical protein
MHKNQLSSTDMNADFDSNASARAGVRGRRGQLTVPSVRERDKKEHENQQSMIGQRLEVGSVITRAAVNVACSSPRRRQQKRRGWAVDEGGQLTVCTHKQDQLYSTLSQMILWGRRVRQREHVASTVSCRRGRRSSESRQRHSAK